MNLAVSNLAFNSVSEVQPSGINLIECVFSKIGDICSLSLHDVSRWRDNLPANIIPYSVQSITYNTGIQQFNMSQTCIDVIDKIIEFSKFLNLKRIVYGSPTTRIIKPDVDIFKYIDEKLQGTDIVFCIEPNTRHYNGHYFFDIEEISAFIDLHKFSNVSSMIDTHNAWLEERDIKQDITRYKKFIQHVHASEVNLKKIESVAKHEIVSKALHEIEYSGVITLESTTLENLDIFKNLYNSQPRTPSS